MKSETSSVINGISRNERLRNGIFFTSEHLVSEILTFFDFSTIHRVIDSAAGSGNFLIPIAEKYPHIECYGIEKHPEVFNKSKKLLQRYSRIHYFQGDILTDSFHIPPCDLYLGNPPFINFTDLPEDYRKRIRPLWQKYLNIPGGFSLLLGSSRADISQLIFQKTLEDYLTPGGQLGVILPDSLLWGDSSMGGFQQTLDFSIKQLKETPNQNAFDGTNRSSFYLIGTRGEKTEYPLPFFRNNGTKEYITPHKGKWQISGSIQQQSPEHWRGHYQARQGLNTLGANKVFFFKEKPPLEDELLHPLLRSSDVFRWGSAPRSWCLLPYRDGKLLARESLAAEYPASWAYLQSHQPLLEQRKSRFAQKNWQALFGIGAYSFAPFRVTWRALGARKMEAAVISRGMANQSMHCFIPVVNQEEAFYLAGILNSPSIDRELKSCTKAGSMSFGQPGILSRLTLPPFEETGATGKQISHLSRKLHEGPDKKKEEELFKLAAKLLKA